MSKIYSIKQKSFYKSIFAPFTLMVFLSLSSLSAKAVDPPYQQEMERLVRILGSLYFLQPLCGYNQTDWQVEANELINLDKPDNERKQRLIGAFNQGYIDYAQSYNICTPSAIIARNRLLEEAQTSSSSIHTRFAE